MTRLQIAIGATVAIGLFTLFLATCKPSSSSNRRTVQLHEIRFASRLDYPLYETYLDLASRSISARSKFPAKGNTVKSFMTVPAVDKLTVRWRTTPDGPVESHVLALGSPLKEGASVIIEFDEVDGKVATTITVR